MSTNPEGSEYDRLFYPFLFAGGKANPTEILAQVRHSTIEKCREIIALRRAELSASRDLMVASGQAMALAFARGATLFAFGNGGSATDAQDMVTDLVNPPHPNWPSLPALSLTNDIAVVTAIGNDVGYDKVFLRQIIAFGREGDIAVGFSTSGNSANVLAALDQARKQGMLTIGLAGNEGGKMLQASFIDFCILSPCDHIPRIQEGQATIYHSLLEITHTLLKAHRTQEEVKKHEHEIHR